MVKVPPFTRNRQQHRDLLVKRNKRKDVKKREEEEQVKRHRETRTGTPQEKVHEGVSTFRFFLSKQA